jgi:hypothetical protein
MVERKCSECDLRRDLIVAEWNLIAMTDAANVHQIANLRMAIVSALERIRRGAGRCEICNIAERNLMEKGFLI